MIATMVSDENFLQIITLSNADGNAQHDSITERNHRTLHIIISIMTLRNCIGTFKKRTLEILMHETQIYRNMLDSQTLTMHLGERNFTLVMITSIVKTNAERNLVFLIVEQRDAIHATAHNDY